MRSEWPATVSPDSFSIPREVFALGLKRGSLLVYLYLICRKSLKHGAGEMSCAVIGKAVGLCEKTVRKHLRTLTDAGFINVEDHGRTFSYALCPIQGKVREHGCATPRSRWRSAKQTWLTGEAFDAVFSLPNAVFQLGLKGGSLLVYLYLQYQKGARSNQCWPSYATIGRAVGLSRKAVQKHIGALIDKGFIRAEETTIRRKNGRSYNGSRLYTLKPVEQILRDREAELLAELKLADAQRRWNQRHNIADEHAEKCTTL